MHEIAIERFRHDHAPPAGLSRHERGTRLVVVLTAAMMAGELVVGTWTGSMALLADGWHMATHVGAIGLAAFAYWFARTRAREAAFSFGTGKVYALAGYTSAVALGLVALLMMVESVRRLFVARTISFDQALPVAALGLGVNLVSAWLLDAGGRDDEDARESDPGHQHRHRDHNLRAAYLHVLADAMTSVLAIVALLGGRYLGWTALDPIMGIVGGAVILHWGWGLCRGAAIQLLDMVPSRDLAEGIRERLETIDDVRVADLHLWETGPGQRACIASLVTATPREASFYAEVVRSVSRAGHVTIEVHRCPGHDARCA
jgi:cation diffusion facilitator family transporter